MILGLAAWAGGGAPGGEVVLSASNPQGVTLPAWPVTIGVPFPVGEVPDAEGGALLDGSGALVPAQFTVQTQWWARRSPAHS